MKVVITAATEKELALIKERIDPLYTGGSLRMKVSFHESGVGLLQSSFSISRLIFTYKPELVIQVGIAGTFDSDLPLTKVITIKEEQLADTGVEEGEMFKDIFDLNLANADAPPFSHRKLLNPHLETLNYLKLDELTGVTINEISTRPERIELLKTKYNAQVESMEGAALHYCCLETATPFIQIRAISNYIGERDKSKWKFKESFDNLTTIVIAYLDHLYNIK